MKRFQAAISISAVLLAGCGPQHDGSAIVARVGDVVLTEVELADQLPDQLDEELAAVERSQFIEDWVRQELIFREALDLKVHEKAHVQRLIEQARRDLVVASFLDSVLANRPVDVSDETLTEYYRANQTDFLRTRAETRAQHILLATRGDADALRKKLLEGDSFEKAAEEFSLDQETKTAGGDLGYFTADDLPELWETCRNLSPGMLSSPVPAERGYHLVRVLAHEPAGSVMALEQVRSEVVERIVSEEHRRRLRKLVETLKARHSWQIAAD